jgi:intein/homing endonuclease
MKEILFPDIKQFKEIIRTVKDQTYFVGLDENNQPIYDGSRLLPTLSFHGSVKLHGCFEENSEVTLANGEKEKIKNLKPGNNILSYDLKTNEFTNKKILNVFKQTNFKKWCKLVFDDREIICTTDHKIFTKNRGWVEAQFLKFDDEFLIE